MHALGQPDQGATGAAGGFQHQWSLLGDRALQRAVVERNRRHDWRAQVPFHFVARVMKTRVVAVQDQTYQTTFNSEQSLELFERGARMPQSNQIRGGHQDDVLRAGQRNTVAGRGTFYTQPFWANVDDNPAIALSQLVDEPLQQRRTDAAAHLAFRRTAQEL